MCVYLHQLARGLISIIVAALQEVRLFVAHLCFLVDPVELSVLVLLDLTFPEPQSNLFLGALDAIGAVTDVSANVDGIVASDGARGRCERVGSTKNGSAGLTGISSFPDHSDDGTAEHV